MKINDIATERVNGLRANATVNDIDERDVELIADKLVQKFGSVSWRPFFCKVARSLPQAKIWELAEIATEKAKHSRGGYFTALACKEMGYRPGSDSDD